MAPNGRAKNPAAKVMAKELQAMMSANTAQALKLAAEAATLEDAMGIPSGPPDTFKPAHELYAELLLKTGRREDARKQFDISLSRAPNRRLSEQGMRVVGIGYVAPVPLDFSAVAT